MKIRDVTGIRKGKDAVSLREEAALLLHLDGDANDASGNGFNGTLYGDAKFVDHETWKSKGGQEKILYLDGDNDYVDMGFGQLDRGYQFTVSCWVKAENEQTILIKKLLLLSAQ
ncbi:MAG: hypothetical protein HQK83_14105 [Fibrobacteria bacterium]|nr:hypothetical protein [Fibrobacteria bacterium]